MRVKEFQRGLDNVNTSTKVVSFFADAVKFLLISTGLLVSSDSESATLYPTPISCPGYLLFVETFEAHFMN